MNSYTNSMKRQISNKAKTMPKKFGRTLRRVGVGAAGAVPLALLAAGAGAATGDPAKAAAMAMAAGSAGASFTNYYGDKLAGMHGTAMKSGVSGFWNTELKKREQLKFDKKFMESQELDDSLMKAFGDRKEVEKIRKSRICTSIFKRWRNRPTEELQEHYS